ncbi:MAG: cytochrome b/b6 domain-containing protein [Alphaproteobacteria bacterium]|nr:cytochrome b/b6 domain-containing protein [Alphaproteobacteria bacterium]
MEHRQATHHVPVWDLPTRLFHWALVGLVVVMLASGLAGRAAIHLTLGPALLALVLFRLVWGVIGSPTARFTQFVKGPGAALAYLAAARAGTARSIGHNPLGAYSVLALLGLLLAQTATGLFTTDDIAANGPLAHLVSSASVKLASKLHRLGYWVLLAFVALHLAAVFFYRFVKKDDLVRAMVTGTKEVPTDIAGICFASSAMALVALVLCGLLVWGTLALLPPPPAF